MADPVFDLRKEGGGGGCGLLCCFFFPFAFFLAQNKVRLGLLISFLRSAVAFSHFFS